MNGKLMPEEKARIREEKLRREALEREADFAEVEQLLGKDAADALRDHYALFDDRYYRWLASLFDPKIGGFYYSKSAQNTDGYLPDLESTKQALAFFSNSGMTRNYETIYDAYPEWMRERIINFVKPMQCPEDGYFYHPQWGKNIISSRQGRDLGWATSTLKDFRDKPKWDTPNGHKGEFGPPPERAGAAEQGTAQSAAQGAAVYPERLRTVADFRKYLVCELNGNEDPSDLTPNLIRTKSYPIGNGMNATTGQIKQRERLGIETGELIDSDGDGIADNGFIATFCEVYGAWQLPYNGLWEPCHSVDADGNIVEDEGGDPHYNAINGLMKLSTSYNALGVRMPYAKQALQSAIKMAAFLGEHEDGRPGPDVMGKRPNGSVDVYNPWVAVQAIFANLDKFYTKEERLELQQTLKENAAAMIRTTTKKSVSFAKEDGSYGYTWQYSPARSQNAPVAVPETVEGDINGGCIAVSGITRNMCAGLGVKNIPIFRDSDFDAVLDIFEQLREDCENGAKA